MTREAILELIRKVKKLADKGVGGESIAAKAKFKTLCEKYNLSEKDFDLAESETSNRYFIYKNEHHRALLSNIICMILDVPVFKCGESNNVMRIKMTDSQYADTIEAYNHYKDMFDDYCRYLVQGIMSRNAVGFFPKPKPQTEPDPVQEPPPEIPIPEAQSSSSSSSSKKEEIKDENPFDMIKLMKIAVALDKKPWIKHTDNKNLLDSSVSDMVGDDHAKARPNNINT